MQGGRRKDGDDGGSSVEQRDSRVLLGFAAPCMRTVAAALGDRDALFGTAGRGREEWSGAEAGGVWYFELEGAGGYG